MSPSSSLLSTLFITAKCVFQSHLENRQFHNSRPCIIFDFLFSYSAVEERFARHIPTEKYAARCPLPLPTPEIPDKGKGKCKLWKARTQRFASRSMQMRPPGLPRPRWDLGARWPGSRAGACAPGPPAARRAEQSGRGSPGPAKAPALTSETLAGRASKQAGLTLILVGFFFFFFQYIFS